MQFALDGLVRRVGPASGCAVLAMTCLLSFPAGLWAAPRLWSDATGKFQVKADYVSEADGKVTLKQEDGTEIEIEVSQLSKNDQDYLKRQAELNKLSPFKPKAASPFQPKAPSPFQPRAGSSTPAPAGGSLDDSGAFESRLVAVDSLGAPPLSLATTGDGWKVEVTPVTAAAQGRLKVVTLPPKTQFHEKVTGIVFNPAGTHSVVGYRQDFPKPINTTRLLLVDLKAGRVTANRTTGGQMKPVALSDDGRTVVMCRDEFGFGNHDRLEVWVVTSSAIQKGDAWLPYDAAENGGRDVIWGEFLPDGKLITSSGDGLIVAWGTSPIQALWSCEAASGCEPAVSPDGKLLALGTAQHVCLIDLGKEETIASQPAIDGAFPKFSFSPSGTRFACMTQSGGRVWETATGETYRQLDNAALPAMVPAAPVFAGEDHVLLGQRYLIDLPSHIALWQYDGLDAVVSKGELCWGVVSDSGRGSGSLIPAKLPHPAVAKLLEEALADPNYFLLKAGGSIKLNLEALPDAAQREKIRENLTKRLLEKEIKVDPAAPVELIASFDPPQQKNVIYHVFGGGMQAVDFNETVARIKIVWQGQTLWQSSAGNQPFSVSRKDGESLQDAVRRYEQPSYGFFEHVKVPGMLARPNDQGRLTLGSSRVTASGI